MRVAVAIGVTGVLWMAVPRLDVALRGFFAERLAAHAAASSPGTARLAVRELADRGLVAVPALVSLAGSVNEDAAEAARDAVSNQLAAWRMSCRSSADTAALRLRLKVLTESLQKHAPGFKVASRAWSHGVALEVARISELLPAADALEVLASCDKIVALPTAGAPVASVPDASVVKHVATAPRQSRQAAPRYVAPRPLVPPADIAGARPELQGQAPLANGDLHVVEPAPVTPVLPLEIPEPPAAPTILADDPAASRPLPLPAPHDEPVALDVPAPQEARLLLRRYRQLSDRDLAAQLAGAAAYDARVIQQVLRERQSTTTARGPSTPRPTLLDAERELFDRVSGLPPAEGRRLLRDLAASNSEPADIRLQALTLLATSGDPQLASIARQRALEDADPRVADLAAKILRDQQTK